VLPAAARQGCLVSDELLAGQNYLRFKEDVFRLRPTRTAVVGSSRVLKIASRPGERTFANLGLPSTSPASMLQLFRALPKRPLTMYVGVELFWFNPSWRPLTFHEDLMAHLRYLLSRSNLKRSWDIVRDHPELARRDWRTLHVGRRCVLGRTSPYVAWNLDGSRLYSFELDPRGHGYRPPAAEFTTDVEQLRFGLYARWRSFDRARLAQLDEALTLARRRGWNVVGFAPPDPTRYVRVFETSSIAPWWREFARDVPTLFRKHGFRWVDLRDVRSVPCAQTDFVDAGFHTNARCSARIRARLDAAAGLLSER
jgi:hypothetical protein